MTTAGSAATSAPAARLGFAPGQVIQEVGYDDDVDDAFRAQIEQVCGSELEDEDFGDVADAVLLWWRDEDGDLFDALVNSLTNLADRGFILVVTPKSGRDGYVDASDIEEAALTAGLHASGSVNAGKDWSGTRLVAPRNGRR